MFGTKFKTILILLSLCFLLGTAAATKFIRDDATGGDCTSIGTWSVATKTCSLTTDVSETIQMEDNSLILDGGGHTINGSGSGNGVLVSLHNGVTIQNAIIMNFTNGVFLDTANDNTLANNTFRFNNRGIFLQYASNNVLSGNQASDNTTGILFNQAPSNTLNGNTATSNNEFGIDLLSASGNSTFNNNIMSGNNYNFALDGRALADFDNSIDTTNTVDGKPIYYVKNVSNAVYDGSTNAGVFYCISCNNVTVKDLTLAKNYAGVYFWETTNSRIENVNASLNSTFGLRLASSSGNTLAGNTVNSNGRFGIFLADSSNNNNLIGNSVSATAGDGRGIVVFFSSENTLTANGTANNNVGIYLEGAINNIIGPDNTARLNSDTGISLNRSSQNNQVYNNNFVDNATQAFISANSVGNVFNLAAPTGGNFWSNYDTPAEGCNNLNNDSFCDAPYVFTGAQDNLPWTVLNGWQTLPATIDADPNTLNTKSKGSKNAFTVYIEIPGADVSQIDVSTVILSTSRGHIAAQLAPTTVGDHDSNGIPDRMVKFDRQALIAIVQPGDHVPLTVTGTVGSRRFQGTSEIRVI